MGLAPTGKPISFAEVDIFRVVDGKIVEKWGLIDRLTRAQQLGVAQVGGVRSEYLYSVEMDVEVHDLGAMPKGWRRIVGVNGGRFSGPKLNGIVPPNGGDWLLRRPGAASLDVRVTLQTNDGALIYASYQGISRYSNDVRERLNRGEPVDRASYYFRTAPLFEISAPKYAWLNHVLAVAIGNQSPGKVGYAVYAIL
jgi:hypothetical protein